MRSRAASSRALVVTLALAIAMTLTALAPASAAKVDPRKSARLFTDPYSSAAAQGGAYKAIAAVPQARWLTEHDAIGSVGRTVSNYVGLARRAGRTPQIVLYGIPLRDCGSYSAGGWATSAQYQSWVNAIARGLGSSRALVIIEPDALATSDTCGGAARIALLRWTAHRLAKTKAWSYLDAGHSAWIAAPVMTSRLVSAGARWARGISLNVSNYRSTSSERSYGAAIVAGLAKRKVRGRHLVIDTSRNGAKPASAEWCNPIWARLGAKPRMLHKKGLVDGYLWIKHPGESDGLCSGGPTAGLWSDLLADRLLGRRTS